MGIKMLSRAVVGRSKYRWSPGSRACHFTTSRWDQTAAPRHLVKPSCRPSSSQQKGIRVAGVQRQGPPSRGREFLAAPRRRSFAAPRKRAQAGKDLNGQHERAVRTPKEPQTALGYSGRFIALVRSGYGGKFLRARCWGALKLRQPLAGKTAVS